MWYFWSGKNVHTDCASDHLTFPIIASNPPSQKKEGESSFSLQTLSQVKYFYLLQQQKRLSISQLNHDACHTVKIYIYFKIAITILPRSWAQKCKSYCHLQSKEAAKHKLHNQGSKSFCWLKQGNIKNNRTKYNILSVSLQRKRSLFFFTQLKNCQNRFGLNHSLRFCVKQD